MKVFASKSGTASSMGNILLLLCVGLSFAACGTDEADSPISSSSNGEETPTDNAEGPVSQQAAVPIEEPREDATIELGVNVTGKSTPDSFSPLLDGGDLHVELGFQGSYMVVLAFRTKGFVSDGKVNLIVSLSADGETKASLKYKKKSLLPGADGYQYFYNIFLVTEDYLDYVDSGGQVDIEILTLDDEPIVSVVGGVMVRSPL